jgi:hypothetical protein
MLKSVRMGLVAELSEKFSQLKKTVLSVELEEFLGAFRQALLEFVTHTNLGSA